MLIRVFSRLIVIVGPLLIIGYTFFGLFHSASQVVPSTGWPPDSFNELDRVKAPSLTHGPEVVLEETLPTALDGDDVTSTVGSGGPETSASVNQESLLATEFQVDGAGEPVVNESLYREIFSLSTADRKYFAVNFGPGFLALNPNIIPHPQHRDTWIVVAQQEGVVNDATFQEVVCNAVFDANGALSCTAPPTVLPVAPTMGDKCVGELSQLALNVGPHDMRLFNGPFGPLVIFGSQSVHTCFGLFVQDFRPLVNDFGLDVLTANQFASVTELQRPPPWGTVEKNWFLFWDMQGQTYIHHDVEPKRVFTQLSADGSVGPDLAPLAAASDDACMAKYMPKRAPENENLHQATNSLAVTLCKRSDPSCQPSHENTFVMTIFQHKTWYEWHGMYKPYVMLFQQNPPFAIHAISQKGLWIHGRGLLTAQNAGRKWKGHEPSIPKGHSEMFYVTSMSWKEHGQRFHGYIDDVLFLGFGIEDSRTAAIDIVAGDLLQDLGYCTGGSA